MPARALITPGRAGLTVVTSRFLKRKLFSFLFSAVNCGGRARLGWFSIWILAPVPKEGVGESFAVGGTVSAGETFARAAPRQLGAEDLQRGLPPLLQRRN